MKEGIDADKAKMNKAFANVKEKAQITKQQIEKKSNEVDNELNAKLDKMEQQMKNAGEKRKARLQKRISALKEEYRIRREKLQQASRLINRSIWSKKESAALEETVHNINSKRKRLGRGLFLLAFKNQIFFL